MTKYKYLQVHTLHYTLVDEEGNDNGKVYEYDGDHSLFCDGIDFNDLKEIKNSVKTILRLNKKLSLLHCVSDYPAKKEEINLTPS